eukprot:jgi/Botrbrau1/14979/Bobra.0018s0079.1
MPLVPVLTHLSFTCGQDHLFGGAGPVTGSTDTGSITGRAAGRICMSASGRGKFRARQGAGALLRRGNGQPSN